MSGVFQYLQLLLVLGALALPAAGQVVLTPQEQAIADRLKTTPGQHRPFLQLDPVLTQVARARALDLGRRGYFDHVNPDGHGPNYLVRAAGYQLPAWWGNDPEANYIESIAGGRASASTTWNDWMNSPEHRDHLLANTSFDAGNTSYGVGYAAVEGSPLDYYWVVITCPPRALAINTPAQNTRFTTPTLALSGTANSEGAPASVVYRIENSAGAGAFISATGVASWSAVATGFQPGANSIRVRSLNVGGAVIAEQVRTVTYVVVKPLTVAIAGSGLISTGYLGTTDREVGKVYTILTKPAAGFIFADWSGTETALTSSIRFTMAEGTSLTANFIPNPFPARTGGYTGLLAGSRQGMVQLSVTGGGAFTGTLRYGPSIYALRGQLTAFGDTTVRIVRHGLPPLLVTLHLDVETMSGVTASVDDAGQLSSARASAAFRFTAGSFEQAGAYTIALPPFTTEGAPRGSGYGLLSISTLGRAKLSVGLPDGTVATVGGTFSGDGTLSLYAVLYAKKGSLGGTLTLRPQEGSDLDGTIRWTKPALPKAKYHQEALDDSGPMIGAHYVRPARGTPVLELTATADNSELVFWYGDLAAGVTQKLTIDDANHVLSTAPLLPKLKVTINAASGLFSGSFVHPVTGRPSPLRGAFLQKQNRGVGYFLGAEQSGFTRLDPM